MKLVLLASRHGFYRALVAFFLLIVCSVSITHILQAQSCRTSCPVSTDCSGTDGPPQYPVDPCQFPNNNGCPGGYGANDGCCSTSDSPILLDLDGKGFHLTDAANGVWFRVFSSQAQQYKVAWPEQGSQNGWLVLDRNGNGLIDDFSELFGNETPQPAPPAGIHKNGFLALAVYDSPDHGGNGDGRITKADAIFSKLRVWVDSNHDGVSQPNELRTLDEVGVAEISLKYELSWLADVYGNLFRYRSTITDTRGGTANKVDYDVFVKIGFSQQQANKQYILRTGEWPQASIAINLREETQH